MNFSDLQKWEERFVERNALEIMGDTGLSLEIMQEHQPVLDLGAGLCCLWRYAIRRHINVISLEPRPRKFRRDVLRELARQLLVEQKGKSELSEFNGVLCRFINRDRQGQDDEAYVTGIIQALERHGVEGLENEDELTMYVSSPDEVDIVEEPIEDCPNIISGDIGMVVSHKALPFHNIHTVDQVGRGVQGIVRVLRSGGLCRMGPGPIAISRIENGEIITSDVVPAMISQCHCQTLDFLGRFFESDGITSDPISARSGIDSEGGKTVGKYIYKYRKKD